MVLILSHKIRQFHFCRLLLIAMVVCGMPSLVNAQIEQNQSTVSNGAGIVSGGNYTGYVSAGQLGTYLHINSNFVATQGIILNEISFVTDTGTVCCKIVLQGGWNIFSIYNYPNPADMGTNFQPFIDNGSLVKIQDEKGDAFENVGIFGGWRNGIGDIEATEGYKIALSKPDSLELCGNQIEYPFAIPLSAGWNIMGYPQQSSFDAENVLQELIDAGTFLKAQDERGNTIEDWGVFGNGITNLIGDFVPGEGYKIKVSAPDTLWINESYIKSGSLSLELVRPKHFIPVYIGNGSDHMNMNLSGSLFSELNIGDELGVFDNGICVGAVTVLQYHLNNEILQLVASASDGQSINGFRQGNPYSFKLWVASENREYTLDAELRMGPATFIKEESAFLTLTQSSILDVESIEIAESELNCYPTPFSDELKIQIGLTQSANVEIDVLNLMGQRVQMILNEQMLARGLYNYKWKGRTMDKNGVSPGIYIVRFKINEKYKINKVVFSPRN